jgi:hypothetical protein
MDGGTALVLVLVAVGVRSVPLPNHTSEGIDKLRMAIEQRYSRTKYASMVEGRQTKCNVVS